MHIVRELVGELQLELVEHRRAAIMVSAAVLVLTARNAHRSRR